LLDLLGNYSDGGEKLYHDFNEYICHGPCWGDFGIDIEAVEEVFHRLDHVYERVVARTDVISRLVKIWML
jgi:hypothetical protein